MTAWIEIIVWGECDDGTCVAVFMTAWIEIATGVSLDRLAALQSS